MFGKKIIAHYRNKKYRCLGDFGVSNKDKGQLISKANCQAVNSSKKRTNEFGITSMRRVFVRFLEKIEDTKKTFRNYLTFSRVKSKI